MKYNVVLWSKKNDDGTHSLKLYLGQNRVPRHRNIPGDYSIEKKYWDKKNGCVRPTHPNGALINSKILSLKTAVQDALLRRDGTYFTHNEIFDEVLGEAKPVKFKDIVDKWIDSGDVAPESRLDRRVNINRFIKFMNDENFVIRQLTPPIVNRYVDWILKGCDKKNGKPNSGTTVNIYCQSLKQFWDWACKCGYIPKGDNPVVWDVKGKPKERVPHSTSEFKQIMQLDLPEGSNAWDVRNYYLFSLLTQGMRVLDVILLKEEDVSGNVIRYGINKQGLIKSVRIDAMALKILEYYRGKNSPYCFPIVNQGMLTGPDDKKQLYLRRCKTFIANYVRKINQSIGVNRNSTFHSTRNAIGNFLINEGVNVRVLQGVFQHSHLSTTERYMAQYKATEVNEYVHEKLEGLYGKLIAE